MLLLLYESDQTQAILFVESQIFPIIDNNVCMNEQRVRWDDLQIVLAIAETGSLSGAGRRLRTSHATVYRRLADMEQRLGVALFHRTRSGYVQTTAG
ncbi:LysR family transcriptional regulator [Marinobacter sp.]|uniref:helix-turn-helix domain-containing protein n=1 Tax=Marinobacter sp. TaxID=50741 RepID=UPI0035693033